MKRVTMNIWIIILAIIFFPFTLIVGIYYLVCLIKEYPKYKNSYSKKIKRIRYSHHYYKSFTYQLFERLKEEQISIDLVIYNYCYYLEGKNLYFFPEVPLYFEVKEGSLFISIDGDESKDYKDVVDELTPTLSKEKYMLIYKDNSVNFFMDNVDISNYQSIIAESDIETITQKIIANEQ